MGVSCYECNSFNKDNKTNCELDTEDNNYRQN